MFEGSTDNAGSDWDAGGVGSPNVVYMPEKKRWRMYYTGYANTDDTDDTDDTGSTGKRSNADGRAAGVITSSIGVAESIDEYGMVWGKVTM